MRAKLEATRKLWKGEGDVAGHEAAASVRSSRGLESCCAIVVADSGSAGAARIGSGVWAAEACSRIVVVKYEQERLILLSTLCYQIGFHCTTGKFGGSIPHRALRT